MLKTVPEIATDPQREDNDHEIMHIDRILGKQPVRKRWMDSKIETTDGRRGKPRKSNGLGSKECVSRATSLPFKNGRDEEIGKLIFDQWSPGTRIRSLKSRKPTTVTAQWECYKPGIRTTLFAKEAVMDRKIKEWAQKRERGFLPWAISRIAGAEEATPFVTELIRVGGSEAGSYILDAEIR